MKILLVSEDIPAKSLGGLGRYVVALGNALIAAGHEVALLGRDTPSYADCAAETGFRGRFIAGFGNPLKGWKEPQLGFFNPWKRPFFAKRLASAIQRHADGFDVVHYHGHQPMVGRYIPASLNFVQSRHDQGGDCITNMRFKNGEICKERSATACAKCIHQSPGGLRTFLSSLAVRLYRQYTSDAYATHPVVFVSEFLRKNYVATQSDADLRKSVVIHNFADEKRLAELRGVRSVEQTSQGTKIHIAGRLDSAKGIAELLDLLIPRLPQGWIVSVCGDGNLRPEIERKHGCRVLLHGHTSHEETLKQASGADVCVVPSLWEEAFGLVTLEALRLGKICYALSRGGTPELVRYGAEGQLRLFDTLPQLVEGLLSAAPFEQCLGGEMADAEAHVAILSSLYRQRLRVSE